MNPYNHYDLSLWSYDFNLTDSVDESFSLRRNSAAFLNSSPLYHYDEDKHHRNDRRDSDGKNHAPTRAPPPKHRHDGSSPLPLGMDWSPPPRKLEGRDSVWPHDPQTGWSYCAIVPSWTVQRKSRVSDPVVFYRVQVGIQSPEGVTSVQAILRRFNDFLNLFYELKTAFPKKDLPPTPPKKILRIKSRELLEERRCSLEDWMQKLLSDIDLSRSLQVALFLELEAAVRSSFHDPDTQYLDINTSTSDVSSMLLRASSDVSVGADNSSITSDYGDETRHEISELGTTKPVASSYTDLGTAKSISEQDLLDSLETNTNFGMFNANFLQTRHQKFSRHKLPTEEEESNEARDKASEDTGAKPLRLDGTEFIPEIESFRQGNRGRRLSTESVGSDLSSVKASESSNFAGDTDLPGGYGAPTKAGTSIDSDFKSSRSLVTLPSEERLKLNRVLSTFQQRLVTARTDMEDLIARLNQEVAVRQFLTTKVKDLEVELETTTQSCKENMEQTVLNEKERVTQMQWDNEELRRKCMELELKLKSEEEQKVHAESANISIMDENKTLLEELDATRDQLDHLQKRHEELELKSKTDVKLLVKEVKSLRNSQIELKHELGRVMKEKMELERVLEKEKERAKLGDTANTKLLHECRILIGRLRECSVNFLVEEEDKLIVDTSLPSDAIDLLTTSDNRIGLLLAETQLLAQEIESAVTIVDESDAHMNGGDRRKIDDGLRKMVTDILVDNATLRMQVNSVIRCALKTSGKTEDDDDEEDEEEASLRNTVLSKFLER